MRLFVPDYSGFLIINMPFLCISSWSSQCCAKVSSYRCHPYLSAKVILWTYLAAGLPTFLFPSLGRQRGIGERDFSERTRFTCHSGDETKQFVSSLLCPAPLCSTLPRWKHPLLFPILLRSAPFQTLRYKQ